MLLIFLASFHFDMIHLAIISNKGKLFVSLVQFLLVAKNHNISCALLHTVGTFINSSWMIRENNYLLCRKWRTVFCTKHRYFLFSLSWTLYFSSFFMSFSLGRMFSISRMRHYLRFLDATLCHGRITIFK